MLALVSQRAFCQASVSGPKSIEITEQRATAGNESQSRQWKGPPNSSSEEEQGVGSGVSAPIEGNDTERGEQILGIDVEAFGDPRALERGEVESTAGEHIFHEAGETTTGGAGGIIKDPTLEPVTITNFCTF